MSHLLYFSSFSPEKFREYFVPPTKDSLQLLFKVDQDNLDDYDISREDLKKMATHILKHGLTYQGLDEAKAGHLDSLFRHIIFSSLFFGLDEAIFDLEERNESNGTHITVFEALLEHAGLIYLQGAGKLKDYPMIQFCMEGRRYGETTPWNEYESYMIFNDEELVKLHHEIQSILERDTPWQLSEWCGIDEFLSHINEDIISPVETAIREKRWLIGSWG